MKPVIFSGYPWPLIIAMMAISIGHLKAQPFVDPLQVRYTLGARNAQSAATPFTHLWAGSDLPLKLKDSTYLLLSPYYENWQFDSASTKNVFPSVQSLAFPIGLILPFKHSKWSLTLMPILRTNGKELFGEKTFQFGGPVFATFARRPQCFISNKVCIGLASAVA